MENGISNSHSDSPISDKTFNIVIVDDDEDDQEFFKDAILDVVPAKVNITPVMQSEKLLAVLEANDDAPDLIFMDLNMPRKSGFEWLSELKSHTKYAAAPIIIISTSANERDINTTYEYGAAFYLRKPSRFGYLADVMRKLLSADLRGSFARPTRSEFVLDYD